MTRDMAGQSEAAISQVLCSEAGPLLETDFAVRSPGECGNNRDKCKELCIILGMESKPEKV